MPIFERLVNFNHEYSVLREDPLIINDISNNSEENKELIKELITSRYNSDTITLLPSCRCGETKGEYSTGIRCSSCGSLVMSSLEDEIESIVWFRAPIGVLQLFNPHILIMLKNRFKKSGFSIIQWLCDTKYKPQVQTPPVIKKLIDAGMERGFNNFTDNFYEILEFLFELKDFKLPNGQHDYLRDLFRISPVEEVFCDYLPLPNKSLLIIEKTNVGVYVDPIIVKAVDAIEMLVSIDKSYHDQKPKNKETRTFKALIKLSEFYEKYYKVNLSPKPGQFRRHIYGTRTIFSCRAVISSLTGPHEYDEIHVPWGIGLTAFRPHLLNKLEKKGLSHNSAVGLLLAHVEKYNPLLDQLLQEIIAEARDGAIWCILQRN